VASLFRWLSSGQTTERGGTVLPITFDQWIDSMSFNGSTYPFVVNNGNTPQPNEEIGGDFRGYVEGIYKRNGVVFACMGARQRLFSEARFQFQRMRAGRPGDLYGTPALSVLESRGRTARPAISSSALPLMSISPAISTRSAAARVSGG
jgi:hypothetical protein